MLNRVHFDKFYSELDLHTSGKVEKYFNELKNKGELYEQDGAVWFKTTKYGDDQDRVLKKADGANTYLTADIAYHMDKLERGFDRLINIWGADHHGYVARVKASIEALGGNPDKLEILLGQLVNLIINGEEVRMGKRRKMVTLDELIDEVGVDATRFWMSMRSIDTTLDFDIELANKNYKIEIPLQVFQYSLDNKKWLYSKKEHIYNHELKNYFYVKIPNINDAILYMSNDSYFPIHSKNRGNYLEFDISQITEKVNETDCFKDDLNIEFEYYDKKTCKENIGEIINQIDIKSFTFDFDESKQCVYISTEFYTEKYKFGVALRNVETNEILNLYLQNGKNYIQELDSQGIYDITKYIEKKNSFGTTSEDKKIIETLEKQTPTEVLFLPSDCQIKIQDLYYDPLHI